MNEIKIFENIEFGKVRTVIKNEGVWFCLTDICRILEIGNPADVKKRLILPGIDTIEVEVKTGIKRDGSPAVQKIKMLFINEANLYKAIFQSRKPEAEKFSDWVTSEVLPSIRKHGLYATENVIDKILNNPDFGIELLTKLKDERRARLEAERRNSILMHVNKTYTATEIAKELGMRSAIELNKKLAEKKIQYKQNNTWVMYSKYADRGFDEIKQEVLDSGRVVYHRKFTQLGRDFILNLLNSEETA